MRYFGRGNYWSAADVVAIVSKLNADLLREGGVLWNMPTEVECEKILLSVEYALENYDLVDAARELGAATALFLAGKLFTETPPAGHEQDSTYNTKYHLAHIRCVCGSTLVSRALDVPCSYCDKGTFFYCSVCDKRIIVCGHDQDDGYDDDVDIVETIGEVERRNGR